MKAREDAARLYTPAGPLPGKDICREKFPNFRGFLAGQPGMFLAGCEGRRFLLALGGGLTIGNWGKSIAIGLSDFLRNAFDHLPRISGARLYIPIIRNDAVQ